MKYYWSIKWHNNVISYYAHYTRLLILLSQFYSALSCVVVIVRLSRRVFSSNGICMGNNVYERRVSRWMSIEKLKWNKIAPPPFPAKVLLLSSIFGLFLWLKWVARLQNISHYFSVHVSTFSWAMGVSFQSNCSYQYFGKLSEECA